MKNVFFQHSRGHRENPQSLANGGELSDLSFIHAGKQILGQEKKQILYTYWLHFAEGSAIPPLLLTLIFNKVEQTSPALIRPISKGISNNVKKLFINPNLTNLFDFMESHFAKQTWFAGDEFSAADIQMSFPIEAAESRGVLKDRTMLVEFLKKIHSRPAYQRALEVGGQYDL